MKNRIINSSVLIFISFICQNENVFSMDYHDRKMYIHIEEDVTSSLLKNPSNYTLVFALSSAGRDTSREHAVVCKQDIDVFTSITASKYHLFTPRMYEEYYSAENPPTSVTPLEQIKQFFTVTAFNYVLYFSGHGDTDGDWQISYKNMDGEKIYTYITLEQIIQIFLKAVGERPWGEELTGRSRLLIVSDCCHSGAWINRLRDLTKDVWLYGKNIGWDIEGIGIQAASRSYQSSKFGNTLSMFSEFFAGKLEKITRKQILKMFFSESLAFQPTFYIVKRPSRAPSLEEWIAWRVKELGPEYMPKYPSWYDTSEVTRILEYLEKNQCGYWWQSWRPEDRKEFRLRDLVDIYDPDPDQNMYLEYHYDQPVELMQFGGMCFIHIGKDKKRIQKYHDDSCVIS